MNKNDSIFILSWAKKFKAIKYLGGKCSCCGETNPVILTLHHNNGIKNFEIKYQMRWSEIEKELKNCILLCGNCHSEEHRKNSKNGDIKENLLKNINLNKCSICGYSGKNFASLVFHHVNRENKKFNINDFVIRKNKNITLDDLAEEISKCVLICKNCHIKEHLDYKYKILYKDICEKLETYKEESLPLDENKIKDLLLSGLKQNEICKLLDAPRSTICTIRKRLLKNGEDIPDIEKKIVKEIECKYCKNKFIPRNKNTQYCSKKCNNMDKNKIPEKEILENLIKEKSTRDIGKILGVSHVTVWNWLKYYSIK